MNHLSLFSGVAGIDIAAHWAGFKTVQFVERDPFCQKVLAKNFPGVPIHDDITTFDGRRYRGIELVSGGFPCQGVSQAGLRKGLSDERSGLFFEMARIVREVAPRWVLIENVSALRTRGLVSVIEEFASFGYGMAWFSYSASSVGAPHQRTRMFLVAYSDRQYGEAWLRHFMDRPQSDEYSNGKVHAFGFWQLPFSGVLRMDDGVPKGLDRDRIRALGNAVVPQQVYPILKAIAEASR